MSWADDKIRIRKNQKKLVEYKKTIRCKECGIRDHRVIDFHHIRDKEFAISNMVYRGYSWKRIQKEIDNMEDLDRVEELQKKFENRGATLPDPGDNETVEEISDISNEIFPESSQIKTSP